MSSTLSNLAANTLEFRLYVKRTRTHTVSRMWCCQNLPLTHDREARRDFCANEWTSEQTLQEMLPSPSRVGWDGQIPARLCGSSPRLGGFGAQGHPSQSLPKSHAGRHRSSSTAADQSFSAAPEKHGQHF